jgi:hypothetical protein
LETAVRLHGHVWVKLARTLEIFGRRWKLLVGTTLAAMLLVVLYDIFFAPRYYQARAIITQLTAAEIMQSQTGGAFVNASTGGALAALSITADRNDLVSERSIAIMNSLAFTTSLAQRYHLDSKLIARDGTDPSKLTQWEICQRVRSGFRSGYDYESGNLKLFYVDSDAGLAKEVLTDYVETLHEMLREREVQGARQAADSLREEISRTTDPLLQVSLYERLAHQIRSQELAELRGNFALRIVEPPMVPDMWYSPRIVRSAVWAGVAVLLLLSLSVLVSDVLFAADLHSHLTPEAADAPSNWYQLVSPSEPYPLHKRLVLIGGLVSVLAFLNWYAPASPTMVLRVLASAIIVAGWYPSWRWLIGSDRGLPFAPLLGLIFPMYYAAPLLMAKRYTWNFGPDIPEAWIVRALWFSLASLVLMLLGYYASSPMLARVMPRARMSWSNVGHAKLISVIFGLVGVAIYAIYPRLKISDAIFQFVVFAADFSLVAITLLFILQLDGQLDLPTRLLLWCVMIPGRVLLALAAGQTAPALETPLLLIFAYASVRRAMPWKWFALGALAFFAIRPVMSPMRALTWKGGPLEGASEITKVKVLSGIATQTMAGGMSYDDMFEFVVTRFADILPFAVVVRETPTVVPYWNGGSYSPLVYHFVPRFLYPEKPKEEAHQAFPHRYGFIPREDRLTLIALPQTMELYCNFGIVGLVVGSLLFGILFRSLHCLFVHPEMGSGAVVAAMLILTQFFSIEWNASAVLGAVIWNLVFIGLVNLVMESGDLRLHPRVACPATA